MIITKGNSVAQFLFVIQVNIRIQSIVSQFPKGHLSMAGITFSLLQFDCCVVMVKHWWDALAVWITITTYPITTTTLQTDATPVLLKGKVKGTCFDNQIWRVYSNWCLCFYTYLISNFNILIQTPEVPFLIPQNG